MSDHSRDTSPDPITLPSSPLSDRRLKNVRSARKRQPTPARRTQRASPAKSLILDTPQAGDASPWRIKVTVQAEQRDGSPGKKTTKTMTVPLHSPYTGRRSRSSSPAKKQSPEKKKATRKRKATPVKERRSAPQLRSQQKVSSEPEPEIEPPTEEEDARPPPPSHTPTRRASGRLARLSAQWSDGTGRTKRLSMAREELDQALQDAMGPGGMGLGDMTLNRAEDFTMLSLESLQTAKEASMAHISHLNDDPSRLNKSGMSLSYLPSSPPKNQYPDISATAARARLSLGSPFDPTPQKRTSLSVPYSTTKSSAKARSSLRNEVDAMSWKLTGPAQLRPSSRALEKRPMNAMEEQWQQERQAISRQVSNANPRDVLVVEDDDDESEDDLDDGDDAAGNSWQKEASRPMNDEMEEQADPDFRPTHSPSEAEDPNYRPRSSQKRSGKFEDLFAHIPEKPPRPKIPRTWRRSSGMDFSYVDSPAHPPPAEASEQRRNSTDGSGVLTPPSTDESEQEIENELATADMQDEADDQLRSEYAQPELGQDQDEVHSGELQDEADDQMQSEFTQPEAEATRFHQDDDDDEEMIDDEDEPSRNDSKDLLEQGGDDYENVQSPADDDTGGFFTSNLPQVYLKDKPKRRPARKPTMDLDELLGLQSSPRKPVSPPKQSSMHSSGKKKSSPAQRRQITSLQESAKAISSPLRKSLLKGSKVQGNAPNVEQAFDSVRTEDLMNNPPVFRQLKELRDSGVKAFDGNGQYPTSQQDKPQSVAPIAAPKRRGRQYFGRNHPNNSQTESTVAESFASKESVKAHAPPQVHVPLQQVRSERKAASPSRPLHQPACALKEKIDTSHQREAVVEESFQQRLRHARADDASMEKVEEHELEKSASSKIQHSYHMHADTYEEEDSYDGEEEEEDASAEPVRSYEENLNLDSPGKIKINFNDSSTRDCSWLNASSRRPPLFDTQLPTQHTQPSPPTQPQQTRPALSRSDSGSAMLIDNKPPPPSQPGLLSRLTNTFWSAVQRPTPINDLIPTLRPKPYEPPTPFPITLQSQIRSRYGILSESFPWTMAHMRTLHRMLNSSLSGRRDSLVPKQGTLPILLARKLHTPQTSIANFSWSFETEHAYTVFAFMQTLVPKSTVDAMRLGEIEILGDDVARRCRGFYDPVRHGDDPVYDGDEQRKWQGKIFLDFVVAALGDCVRANEILRGRVLAEGNEEGVEETFDGTGIGLGFMRPGTRAD